MEIESELMSAPLFSTTHHHKTAIRIPRRRIKMAVARLGSVRRRSWGGKRILLGFLKRLRLRWLVRHYRQAIEVLRKFYAQLLKDLIEGTASMEMLRAHSSLDYYFTTPLERAPVNGMLNYHRN